MAETARVRELVQALKAVTKKAALELHRQSTTDSPPPIRKILRNVFAHAYLMGVEDGVTGAQQPLPLEELLRELELNDYWAGELKRHRTSRKLEPEDEAPEPDAAEAREKAA